MVYLLDTSCQVVYHSSMGSRQGVCPKCPVDQDGYGTYMLRAYVRTNNPNGSRSWLTIGWHCGICEHFEPDTDAFRASPAGFNLPLEA